MKCEEMRRYEMRGDGVGWDLRGHGGMIFEQLARRMSRTMASRFIGKWL